MYAHYEPSEQVFVNREKHLEWMDNALTQCHDQSLVLHLHGIGGIGKTALLEHWKHTIEASLLLDCNRVTHLFDRLETIARNVAQLGIQLRRFDLLWSIRLRFIKGIEPAKEPGRTWAYDVIKPLPFIGSLVNIGKAIHTIGRKLKDQLKHKFGDVSDWLNNRLGSDYSEKLLEILWKDPHHAEFLFLDALLEDLNARKNKDQSLLLLFDHMEDVDTEHLNWRYRGRKISETELWFIFLSSLHNTVGVTASRRRLPKSIKESSTVEELEITELDTQSCHQLLAERGITENEIQTQITSVSGGNPFVLHTICDMNEFGKLSLDDIESLRADTLEQVRIKTWRRLFNQAKGLSDIIDRAGLLPFFNRQIMDIITPTLKSADWDKILQLSFVQYRDDDTLTLHALARELVLAELGNKLSALVSEVADLLEQATTKNNDVTFQGLAFAAKALVNESEAIIEFCNYVQQLFIALRRIETLSLIEIIHPKKEENQTILRWLKARMLWGLGRFAESEQENRETLPLFRKFAERDLKTYLPYVIWTQMNLTGLCISTGQFSQVEDLLQNNSQLIKQLGEMGTFSLVGWPDLHSFFLSVIRRQYCEYFVLMERFNEAEDVLLELIEQERDEIELLPTNPHAFIDLLSNLNFLYLESGRVEGAKISLQETDNIVANPPSIAKDIQWYMKGGAFVQKVIYFMSTEEPQRGIEGLETLRNYWDPVIKDLNDAPLIAYFGWFGNLVGICLRRVHKLEESRRNFVEGLEHIRRGYKKEPFIARFLAMTLNNYATLNRQLGRLSEADRNYQESLQIFQQLTDQSPSVYAPSLAQAFTNYAILLRQTGDISQAEALLREALSIRRKHAKRNPDYYLHRVATSLNNLGVVLYEAKKQDEALEILRESLQLRRELSKKAPILYSKGLASTLTNLGILMKRLGNISEAESSYQEALKIWNQLAEKSPETFKINIEQTLCNLAILLSASDSSLESLDSVMNQLKKMGITSIPEVEFWVENEEDFFRFFEFLA